VLDLKKWCDGCGIKKNGLKQDLINRLDAARSGSSKQSCKHFHELFSTSGDKMIVTLSSPDKDDECPLTLDTVSNDSLEFLPSGSCFVEESPSFQKMSLPCGHCFGALNLIYHFFKNNMQCPCCRAGPSCRAALRCVPKHLRTALSKQVKRIENQERAEHTMEEWRSLLQSAWGSLHYGAGSDESDNSDEGSDDYFFSDDSSEDNEDFDDDDERDEEDDEHDDDEDDESDEGDAEEGSFGRHVDDHLDGDDTDLSDEEEYDVRAMLHNRMMFFATGRALGLL
jgi:hypothetical protein